jgi:hypothetical protein
MKLDDEARALAYQRARRQQGREVVFAGYRREQWATQPDPTAILDDEIEPVVTPRTLTFWFTGLRTVDEAKAEAKYLLGSR